MLQAGSHAIASSLRHCGNLAGGTPILTLIVALATQWWLPRRRSGDPRANQYLDPLLYSSLLLLSLFSLSKYKLL